jgi:SAM-dependent methyltransferase
MDLTEAERRLLIAGWDWRRKAARVATRDELVQAAQDVAQFDEAIADFGPAFESLLARGWIGDRGAPRFGLTERGTELAGALNREQMRGDFGRWMVESERSAAYMKFCRRVYGLPLIQFNMIDAEQMAALLEATGAAAGTRVIDLGCGVGTITEYIGNVTGAAMTGVDFADAAIARALERTGAKRQRIAFRVADLNHLDLPKASFDVAMALDTLYFVEDLPRTVADILALLAPAGTFVAFYSAIRREEDDASVLQPESTRLAQALTGLGKTFISRDFSENDLRFWQASRAATDEMRGEFEAEGSARLWKSRDGEVARLLKLHEEGRMRRYLYKVSVTEH